MTGDDLAAIVREHTAREITTALVPVLEAKHALELRLLELETRPAAEVTPAAKGDPGLQGVGIASLLLSAEGRLVAHLSDGRTLDAGPVPRGVDGAPGMPGERGEKGVDGLQGVPGAAGRDADPSIVLDVKSGFERLQAAVDSLPAPIAGPPGKDGAGIVDSVLDRAGHLVLTLSDGRTKDVGLVIGRDADEARIAALEALELDPLEIEATFGGLLQKELAAIETVSPRATLKRIEKTGTGYTVIEEAV